MISKYDEFKIDKIKLSDEELARRQKLLKKINDLNKHAENSIKPECCPICSKSITSLCKSHSLPAFVLRTIADKGYIKSCKELIGINPKKTYIGVKEAGVFYSICRECDSKYFQDYENPETLAETFSPLMMAEIALKCSLFYLHKRYKEKALISLYRKNNLPNLLDSEVIEMDIEEYKKDYEYDIYHVKKNDSNGYNLGYYKILPYVVPIACQIPIALVLDLNDCLVNDVYYKKPNYKIENCIVCIYPLKDSTIVALFSRNKNNRYRKFFKQLNKLDLDTALEKINYIIFKYSEDFFLSNTLNEECVKSILDIVSESGVFFTRDKKFKQDFYIENYTLKQSNQLPNLLIEQYALNR